MLGRKEKEKRKGDLLYVFLSVVEYGEELSVRKGEGRMKAHVFRGEYGKKGGKKKGRRSFVVHSFILSKRKEVKPKTKYNAKRKKKK